MQNKDFCRCSEHLKERKYGRYECTECKQVFTVAKYMKRSN